ncbi:MAG: class I SAM-dependent methyltransferase [Fidelibacterota bacterium]|nr:MAG: class I SAM-dependent methyltransferase [Candidatus Neomarinimicrobiota bacterium]
MDTPQTNFSFHIMTWLFKLRDLVLPRERILAEVDIQPGHRILDFGCGPGSYTIAAARAVGADGRVYALDMHPLALRSVQSRAGRHGLENIETIQSDCATGLPDNHIDVAFLFDILHGLSEAQAVLQEIHRVLKPEGILSVNDHHQSAAKIKDCITQSGIFELEREGRHTINFAKASPDRL